MNTIIAIVCLALIALGLYARFIEPKAFRTVRATMPIRRDLGSDLDILHISDLHLEKGEKAKIKFLRSLQTDSVDMVIAAGDLIEDDTGIDLCVEILTGFRARLGVFVVFGAHDRWTTRFWNVVRDLSLGGYRKGKPNDFARLKRELERSGVICLENASHKVVLPGSATTGNGKKAELWVLGIDDMFAGLDDFDMALDGVSPDAPRILLTHAVESPEEIAARGFDAVFAGHSHGGQVRIPFYGPIITRSSLPRKYASGIFEVDGTPFHINNGIGTGRWTRIRFLCPPEATRLKLTGSDNLL